MATTLRIIDLDEQARDVRVIAADLIAFEQKFEIAASRIEEFQHMAWLAWKAEHRSKATTLAFEAWAESVDIVTDTPDPKAS
jgi:hypothetical protein